MADYGFAIIAADPAFLPAENAAATVEKALKAAQVIGERLPAKHPEVATTTWSLGPGAPALIRGNPKEISIYVGAPTPFFDGHEVKARPRFMLEVEEGDPSALIPLLEAALQTRLESHPYRL